MKATGTERLPYFAKIGQDVIGFGSVAEVIEKTKLNWAVEKQPIFLDGGKRIEDRFATVRTDTGATLGIVGKNYEVVQNEQGFSFIDDCLGDDITFVRAGTYNRDERVFISAKAPSIEICGDEIIPHILFTNSHDTSGAVGATFTPMRLVCSNGLMLPAKGHEKGIVRIKIPHTKSVHDRLMISKEIMVKNNKYLEAIKQEAEHLLSIPFSDKEFLALSQDLAGISGESEEKVTKGQLTMVEDLALAYQEEDNQKFQGTAWGAITAASDYDTHRLNSRNTGNEEYSFERVVYGMSVLAVAFATVRTMISRRP